jgi:hypothetical protein
LGDRISGKGARAPIKPQGGRQAWDPEDSAPEKTEIRRKQSAGLSQNGPTPIQNCVADGDRSRGRVVHRDSMKAFERLLPPFGNNHVSESNFIRPVNLGKRAGGPKFRNRVSCEGRGSGEFPKRFVDEDRSASADAIGQLIPR